MGTGQFSIRAIELLRVDSVLYKVQVFHPDASWSISRADDGSRLDVRMDGAGPLVLTFAPGRTGENPGYVAKNLPTPIALLADDRVRVTYAAVSRVMQNSAAGRRTMADRGVSSRVDLTGRRADGSVAGASQALDRNRRLTVGGRTAR
jgi:hypothetical protein